MEEAVILSAVRTPVGRYGGALRDVRPDDLAALVIGEAVHRAGVAREDIEDVVLGCANQAGEDNRNVARMALLLAGLPVEVAGPTGNPPFGSGLQAIHTPAPALPAREGEGYGARGGEREARAPQAGLPREWHRYRRQLFGHQRWRGGAGAGVRGKRTSA